MADNLDAMEERMRKIRQGWQGEGPEPGTQAFSERAKLRLERLRAGEYPQKPLEQEKTRVKKHEDILKEAGE